MALNIEPKIPYLRKLVCAYTGEPVTVRMVSDRGGAPLYFSPDAFDPGSWVKDSVELFKKLGMRDGVDGAARNGRQLVCPYTGAKMSVENHPSLGVRASGGFRPGKPVANPVDFARAMMSRGGKVPSGAPAARAAVGASRREDASEGVDAPRVSKDLALAEAESILKDKLPVKTSVTVPAGTPSGKRRARG